MVNNFKLADKGWNEIGLRFVKKITSKIFILTTQPKIIYLEETDPALVFFNIKCFDKYHGTIIKWFLSLEIFICIKYIS